MHIWSYAKKWTKNRSIQRFPLAHGEGFLCSLKQKKIQNYHEPNENGCDYDMPSTKEDRAEKRDGLWLCRTNEQ